MARRRDGGGALFFSRTWDFLERYLPLQMNRSRRTVESYRDSLSAFRRFALESHGLAVGDMTFGDCGRELVLEFIESLRAAGRSAGTCNQRLAAIRSYLNYCAATDVTLQSVALEVASIPKVSGPQRVKERLAGDQVAALISAPDASTRKGVRNRAMLALLYDTGIRLSELIGLDVGDVWLDDEPRILVRGKGRRERFVAITEKTVGHLRALLDCMHAPEPDPSDPLFYVTHHGERCRISDSTVQGIVQDCADEARKTCPGMPERVYPHMLRRSRATDMYQDGSPIEVVSTVLGHASVDTTRAYAVKSLDQVRDMMESAYPETVGEAPEWKDDADGLMSRYSLR